MNTNVKAAERSPRRRFLIAATTVAAAVVLAGATAAHARAAYRGSAVGDIPSPVPETLAGLLGSDQSSSSNQSSSSGSTSAAPSASGSPASAQPVTTQPASPTRTTKISVATDVEQEVLRRVNAVRRAANLRPLVLSAALRTAGRAHVRDLALGGYFAHEWSDGASFAQWIRRFYTTAGFRTWGAAENLVWASPTLSPQQAIDRWLASPTHRKIMLTQKWRQLGVGVVQVDNAGGVYGGQSIAVAAAEFGVRK